MHFNNNYKKHANINTTNTNTNTSIFIVIGSMPNSNQKPPATSTLALKSARDDSTTSRNAQARLGNPKAPIGAAASPLKLPKGKPKLNPVLPHLTGKNMIIN